MKRGFTLLEILLALTIFSTAMIMGGIILIPSLGIWETQGQEIQLRQRGQIALELMIDNLKKARELEIVDEDHIRFQTPEKGWQEYKHYESGGIPAIGYVNGSRTRPLVNKVSLLKFVDINGDYSLIKIVFTLEDCKKKVSITGLVSPR